jgi:hypothetical protein
VAGCCVCGNEHLGSIERGNFMAAEEVSFSKRTVPHRVGYLVSWLVGWLVGWLVS